MCTEASTSGSAMGVPRKPQTFSSFIFTSDFMDKHSFTHSMPYKPAHICSGTYRWTIVLFFQDSIWLQPLVQSPAMLSHSKTGAVFTAGSSLSSLSLQPPCDCAGQSSPALAPTAAPPAPPGQSTVPPYLGQHTGFDLNSACSSVMLVT